MAVEILRTVIGRLLGLDKDSNLVLGGTKVIIGHATGSDQVVDLANVGSGSTLFGASVSATLAAGPLNDLAPIGYVGGTTNRLVFTPASGGSTINGLSAVGVPDGFTILIQNPSTTDSLNFAHLAGGSASGNQFLNENAASVSIPGPGAARATLIVNKWVFA